MKLYCRQYSEQGPPLLILHGLFGNQGNWSAQARELAEAFQVFGVDLRNHGRSSWDERHDYPALAADLADTLDALGLASAHFLGHSMGGKAAMQLAFQAPARVSRLVVVDIAPVSYARESFGPLEGMRAVDLTRADSRAEVDEQLASRVPEREVREFLLTNLQRDSGGGYTWRCNLAALASNWEHIKGFPPPGRYEGPTLFVKGAESDYILPAYADKIQRAFPSARFKLIENAGHWVHAEKPRAFLKIVRDFLDKS